MTLRINAALLPRLSLRSGGGLPRAAGRGRAREAEAGVGTRRAPRAPGEDEVFFPTRHASGVGDSEAPAGGEGAAGRQALSTCLPSGPGRCGEALLGVRVEGARTAFLGLLPDCGTARFWHQAALF